MAGRGYDGNGNGDCDANVNVNKYYKICNCVCCISTLLPVLACVFACVCEQQRHAQVKGEKGNKVGVGHSAALREGSCDCGSDEITVKMK